ncbi:hypothetical protein CEXT_496371 [Caerostris extrusa]|uniref:Uncharacterized protein n=1 Tax=Caerostris extrusa TaxID=172846 RepID=A0AAV4PVG6_CAEEX|nr:hypothetical protein CEXT_496371 [Caerostris extrusa]
MISKLRILVKIQLNIPYFKYGNHFRPKGTECFGKTTGEGGGSVVRIHHRTLSVDVTGNRGQMSSHDDQSS